MMLLAALLLAPAAWRPVTISYYETGRVTSDGTAMCVHGRWVATRAYPLGAVVEIRYGSVTQRLVVRDRTARRYGHRADLPRETWRRFGQPTSRGILQGQWRRIR